ncbi:Alkaline phosphatase synthesis transcriptional regulatory protein PhoP [Caloramator mitchellensis]|uniref:Stage 0 sporulation protein A homolog n=1 Tax=Caloramator mitchellensis TaxID=908809 RepID=A0A0R3JWB7_CALMK|nr:response regulator [Caloramator mitchellensis]KRQ87816.1 Alkaline phosphatase synthesis transcriptional regulatory protein PhoP [Caloramator mitchellensis]
MLKEIESLIERFEELSQQELKERIEELARIAEKNFLFEVQFILLKVMSEEIRKEEVLDRLRECKRLIEENFLKDDEFLFITNNPDEFKELIDSLKMEGFKVAVESYNADIVDYIYLRRPDVVLIDNDERNHGIFLINVLNEEELSSKVPIIIFGQCQRSEKINAELLGAIDCILKPFDSDDVFLKLKNIYRLSNAYIKNNIHDIFTGVYSRYHGEIISKKEFARLKEADGSMIFMLLDFDGMSKINLMVGKTVGNDILKDAADIFKKNVKDSDIIYRRNGDEFAFMFFNKNILEVLIITDKIQKDLENLSKKYKVRISISAGIAEFEKGMKNIDELIDAAKKSLAKAKLDEGGRIYTSRQINEYSKKKILFVDDDKIILAILTKRYSSKGYTVLTASSGEEGLNVFADNKDVNLIVSDFYMPGMTGDEFVKKIRETNKNVKIIVLSAHKSESHVQKALSAGADEYITKPFSPIELDIRIKKLLS